MSAVVGELVWKVTGDTSGIDKSLKQTDQKAQGLAGNFKSYMGTIAGAIVGAAIAKKIFDIGKASIKAAADMETQTVAFTTMLGSADKAQKLIKEVSQFAASTPFGLTELIDASKKLIAFGENSETVTKTLQGLGDVAAGLSIPIGELTEIYGRARVQGSLYAEDLNQLAGRGIPIFTELAKVMGVNASEVKKLGSEGKISFNELEQVFKNLTSEGGQFAGLMAAQSKTLAGQWSNLNDQLDQFSIKLGQELAPGASDLVAVMGELLARISNINNGPDSIGFTFGLIKDVKNLLDGTAQTVETIGERIGDVEVEKILNEVKAWEASSTGVSAKVDDILKKYGDVNGAAAIYSEYVKGHVKLTDEQVRYLEDIIQKHKILLEQANTLTSSYDRMAKAFLKAAGTPEAEEKKKTTAAKGSADERKRIEKEITDFINQNTKTETELLQMELEERKSALLKYSRDREQTAKWIADIEKIYGQKIKDSESKDFEDRINSVNNYVQYYGNALTGLLSAVQSLNEAQGAQAIASLDARMQAELEAAGLAEDSAVQAARVELAEAEAAGNQQVIIEKKKALEKAKIEEKYAKQKAKLEYDIALQSWELQRAMAMVQMLQAPLNAFSSTLAWAKFPGGMALAGVNAAIAALTAGVQYAAVQASKPQAPQFEQGGIVPGSSYTGDNVLARVNSGEMVLNQQQQAQLFNQANGGGGGYRQIPPMAADSLWKLIFEASQSGDLFISERAVTSR